MENLKSAVISSDSERLKIDIPNFETIEILHEWLRDHCRCSKCYNGATFQRKISILDFPSNIFPLEYHLSADGILNVKWSEGHESEYELSWIIKNSKFIGDDESEKTVMIPWSELPEIARVDSEFYMNTKTGLTEVISSLVKYGVAIVTEVEPTLSATEKVIARMSPVQKTLFGEMWEVINNADYSKEDSYSDLIQGESTFHKDTAYTSIALGAHTDNTYWCDAAGLEVFHFLRPAPHGGETLLVDGLRVCNKLKQDHPDTFERLTRVPVSATYLEDGQHHSHVDPTIKLHPVTNEFLQIRFNIYDRSVLRTVPQSEMKRYYTDLRILASIIADKDGENYVKFSPGEVVFIDNWRVMHGRASYYGLRHMGGGYVARTDWRSKAAVLGVLNNN